MDSRSGFGVMVGLMQQSARVMSSFMPGHEWHETRNKLETFRLFAWADEELGIPAGAGETIAGLAGRALRMDPFQSIWALEGIASHHAAIMPQPVEGMLSRGAGVTLPVHTLVSMHAGMGTAFARTVLQALGDQPSKQALHDALVHFLDLCRANARADWFENAAEPLGLAVRTMHPHLLRRVSDALLVIDPACQRLFWHGVGRSLYFVPTNFVSFGSSHERALQTAMGEAPGVEERRNAVAGLVWAVTLVNLRHPEVLLNLLSECEKIRMPEAVVNGIVSALMLWKFMVPGDSILLPPYFRPAPGTSPAATLWNERVMRPTARAFAEQFPAYVSSGTISPVFAFANHKL